MLWSRRPDTISVVWPAGAGRDDRRRGRPVMAKGNADRDLLFGCLALQMDFIGRGELLAALAAWVADKSKDLDQILRAQGAVSPERHALLEGLVREHLRAHGGEARRSLATLS